MRYACCGGAPLAILAAVALSGCEITGGTPGGISDTAIPIGVFLTSSASQFTSITLNTPGVQVGGNFDYVNFWDSEGNTRETSADNPNSARFQNSGSTMTYTPTPAWDFPGAGEQGFIEAGVPTTHIRFVRQTGIGIDLTEMVYIEYDIDGDGTPCLPTSVPLLTLPSEGGPLSDLALTLAGLPGGTRVRLRLAYATDGSAGQVTVEGTADASGRVALVCTDTTVIQSISRITLQFFAD